MVSIFFSSNRFLYHSSFEFRWDESDDGHIDQKELANMITAIVRDILLIISLLFFIGYLV
jgi:hypothetical protein